MPMMSRQGPIRRMIAAAALALGVSGALAVTTNVPPGGLPAASEYSTTLLPERSGIVSWRTLAKVEMVQKGIRLVPQFAKEIEALDAREVTLQGFVIPLDANEAQRRFLLSAVPVDCAFCLPAGPDALVEVEAKSPVRYSLAPVVVSGRFAVLKDDPGGVLYRLVDAVSLGPADTAPAARQ
jgi:hypothetical protein